MRDEYRRRVLNRWKSLEGHVRGVRRMIGELLELFNGGARVGWSRSLPQPELSVVGDGRKETGGERVSWPPTPTPPTTRPGRPSPSRG